MAAAAFYALLEINELASSDGCPRDRRSRASFRRFRAD